MSSNEDVLRSIVREEVSKVLESCSVGGYGDHIRLKSGTEPESSAGPQAFRMHERNGMYQGLPVEFFRVSRREVRLKSKVTEKITWSIDESTPGGYNINAPAQKIVVDGETFNIQPGFFCSYINEEDVAEFV